MGTSDPVALRAIAATRDHAAALTAADTALHQAAVDLADTRATLRDLTTLHREDPPRMTYDPGLGALEGSS